MPSRIPLPDPLGRRPFRYGEARAAGVTAGRLRGSDLARPFHGTRTPGTEPHVVVALCRAYLPVMRADAFFCSTTAATIMRVPLPAALQRHPTIHVAVPHPIRAPEGKGVVGHAVKLMGADRRDWDGLPVSSPERVWCELSAVLTMTQLVAAGDYLVHREYPITSIANLADAVARYRGGAGAALRRECLPYLDTGSESPPESELRVIVRAAGIPGFEANVWITVPGARYRGDLVNVERRMVLEYQGGYHFDLEQQRRDMRRIERLRAAGWYVMQVNLDDLNDPDELVARIRSVFDARPVF
jgi:very-short-patch-repair endonuclease